MTTRLSVDRELFKQYLPDNPLLQDNINGSYYRPSQSISSLFTTVIDFSSREIYGDSPFTLWRGFFPVSFNFPHPTNIVEKQHIQLKLEAQAYIEYYSKLLLKVESKILLALSKDQSTLVVISVPATGLHHSNVNIIFIDYVREKLGIASPTPITITNLYQALKLLLEEKILYYQAVDASLSFDVPLSAPFVEPALPNPHVMVGRNHPTSHAYRLNESDLGLSILVRPEFSTSYLRFTNYLYHWWNDTRFYSDTYGLVWKNIRRKLFAGNYLYHPYWQTMLTRYGGFRQQLTYNIHGPIGNISFWDIELQPYERYPDVLRSFTLFQSAFLNPNTQPPPSDLRVHIPRIGNSIYKKTQGHFFRSMLVHSGNALGLFYPMAIHRKRSTLVVNVGFPSPTGTTSSYTKIHGQSKANTASIISPANDSIQIADGDVGITPSLAIDFNPNEIPWVEYNYEQRDVNFANFNSYRTFVSSDPDFNGVRSLTIEEEVADKKCWVRGNEIDSVSIDLTYDQRTNPAEGPSWEITPAGYILTIKLTDQTLASTYPAVHWYGTDDLSKPDQIAAILHYEPYFRIGNDIVPVSETTYNIDEVFFYIFLEYIKEPFKDDGTNSLSVLDQNTRYGIGGPRNGLTRFFYQTGFKAPSDENIRLGVKLPMIPETLYPILGTIGIRNNFEGIDAGNPINYYNESYEILRPSLVIPFATSRTPFTTSPQ